MWALLTCLFLKFSDDPSSIQRMRQVSFLYVHILGQRGSINKYETVVSGSNRLPEEYS